MRRSVTTTLVAALGATLAISPLLSASAVGPGGWDHVGIGSGGNSSLNGAVYALNTQNPGVLYAGGTFTSAGGNSKAKRVARWNGSSWSALGTTPISNGSVFALAYHAGRLYAGGTFVNAGGNPNADFLAVWDGSTWAPFCTPQGPDPAFTATVSALQIVGNTLYVGGSFADGAGIPTADYLVACDLTTGTARSTMLHDGDINGAVYALTADSNGTLYAGGQFINLADIPDADHIASYDGTSWQSMGGGVAIDSYVRSLTAAGTNVYVGTDSVNVAGIPTADHVARWDGSAWSAVGSNSAGTDGWFPLSSTIDALATYGSTVVAAGSFQNANGVSTADQIAYFDGSRWRPIGSDGAGNGPLPGHPVALGITGGKVYAGGNFTSAGGDHYASYLAAYALRQPDAAIGATAHGHFVGNNVYSSTGAGEVHKVTLNAGERATSYVRIQNDGLVPASFTIRGTGGGNGIHLRYFNGAKNVTSAVRGGTYATGTIAARSSVSLRVEIESSKTHTGTTTFLTVVHSQSATTPDAVRLTVKVKP
jgi:hypothetical protein